MQSVIFEILKDQSPYILIALYIIINEFRHHFLKRGVDKTTPPCNGNLSKCTYFISRNQMNETRIFIESAKISVQTHYAFMLKEQMDNGLISVKSRDISIAIALHKNLVDSAFNVVEPMVRQWLVDNHIPSSSDPSFIPYVTRKFNLAYSSIKNVYFTSYFESIFYVPIKYREKSWGKYRDKQFINTTELFKTFNQIREDV